MPLTLQIQLLTHAEPASQANPAQPLPLSILVPLVVHGQLSALLLGVDKVAELANIHVLMRLIVNTARLCVPQYVICLNTFAKAWSQFLSLQTLPFPGID